MGEGAERFPRLPFHAAFPEQPHPGSPNLMAAFLWSSQDGEGERLEKGGERKQGNASEVRRFFSGRGRLVLFACLQRAAIFRKLERSPKKKMGSFSLFNFSHGSLCREGPSSPPPWAALGTDVSQEDGAAAGNEAGIKGFTSPTATRAGLKCSQSQRWVRLGRLYSELPA